MVVSQSSSIVDFSGKAERRGVRRAAIELTLNLLATNEEQHRPLDRFRRVVLPHTYAQAPEEIRLCADLDPSKRPVEQHPFKITKIMLKYRKWKDYLQSMARMRAMEENPGKLDPPINYNGPYALASEYDILDSIKKRQQDLIRLQATLIHVGRVAPRPLIHRLTTIINDAIALPPNETRRPISGMMDDDAELYDEDLEQLRELCAPSWLEYSKPYPDTIIGLANGVDNLRAQLDEFDRDVNLSMNLIPLWEPKDPAPSVSKDPTEPAFYTQPLYSSAVDSAAGWDLTSLLDDNINKGRQERSQNLHEVHLWSREEAMFYLSQMHNAGRIQ